MTNQPEKEPIEAEVEITSDDAYPALWVRLVDEMIEKGITFGTKYEMAYLVDRLACQPESIAFGIAISNINDELIESGLYLSAREQRGAGYIVLMADGAEEVARTRVRRSFREMARACKLFGGIARNPEAQITDDTKKRLLKCEEKAAIRLSLMRAPITTARKAKLLE
jgi:hypothetical protein